MELHLHQLVLVSAVFVVLGEGRVEEEQAPLRGVVVHLPKTITQVSSKDGSVGGCG